MTAEGLALVQPLGVCSVEEDTRLLAELAAAQPGRRALDLGTGTGYVGIYLAQRGWQVDAVDISPKALETSRRNAAACGVKVNIYHSNWFERTTGLYDVIAFNPPMRPTETEFTRLITSFLRRHRWLRTMLLAVGGFLQRSRILFLVEIIRQARERLTPGGTMLLVISGRETVELQNRLLDLSVEILRAVKTIPDLYIVAVRQPGYDP